MSRWSNISAAIAAFRRARDKQIPNEKMWFGITAGYMAATVAISQGVNNYFRYVIVKNSKEVSEAEIQSIEADPNYVNNGLKEKHLRDQVKLRDSYAEDMKPFKWTARFVEVFPPKS